MNDLSSLVNSAPVPKLFFINSGSSKNQARIIAVMSQAANHQIVRFTGGCGYMNEADGKEFLSLFTKSFNGFEGVALFGGTQMLSTTEPVKVIPGITEIGPAIRMENNSIALGVINCDKELTLENGTVVLSKEDDYVTVIHPSQDVVAVIDSNIRDGETQEMVLRHTSILKALSYYSELSEKHKIFDGAPQKWEWEFLACSSISELLVDTGWKNMLVVYNGGATTLKEVFDYVTRGWPVLIIKGSGRVANELVQNSQFNRQFGNYVTYVERDYWALRAHLESKGVVPDYSSVDGIIKFEKGNN